MFYHLGELDDALTYALGAGALFNVNEDSEYVNTIVCELLYPCNSWVTTGRFESACSTARMGVQMGCPQQHASSTDGPLKTLACDADHMLIRCLLLLTARALDRYFELRVKQVEQHASELEIDPRLTAIVERMLDKCVRRRVKGPGWWGCTLLS